jgi:hypothetical protein
VKPGLPLENFVTLGLNLISKEARIGNQTLHFLKGTHKNTLTVGQALFT